MKRLLIGGSPCTHWSIAQKNNRETGASGLGWELYKNYLIAKEKFKPDYFLYENNKSAAQPIKNEIKATLGAWDGTLLMPDSGARYIEINSALVSAQNRQRFYVHNFPNVEQPEDRGILLKDVLEIGIVDKEKAYCLKHQAGNARDYFKKHHTQIAFEPLSINDIDGKSRTLKAQYSKTAIANTQYTSSYGATMVAEPIRIPEYGDNTKARPLNALYSNHAGTGEGSLEKRIFSSNPGKQQVDLIAEPIRIGTIESEAKNAKHDSKQYRVYSPEGKSTTICGQGGGVGAKTGLYAVPTTDFSLKSIYEVRNGKITIKDKQYDIKLPDGYYIIRKLTVNECIRLQTIPEWYQMPCSASQNYKMLGNGWTVEVIKHIMQSLPKDEPIEVLSMYDGMSCGQITLKELGCNVVKYVSYEIDKYAIQTTQHNFPNTIQRGDAFQVRNANWSY